MSSPSSRPRTGGPPTTTAPGCAASTSTSPARPLTFRGEAVLAPGGQGTIESLDGELKANVPFIGGRIEKAAADPILAAITLEATTLREFLAR